MIPALVYATIFYFLGKAVAKNYNIGISFRIIISVFAFVITFIANIIIIVAITKEDPSPPVGVFTWLSAVAFFIASAPVKVEKLVKNNAITMPRKYQYNLVNEDTSQDDVNFNQIGGSAGNLNHKDKNSSVTAPSVYSSSNRNSEPTFKISQQAEIIIDYNIDARNAYESLSAMPTEIKLMFLSEMVENPPDSMRDLAHNCILVVLGASNQKWSKEFDDAFSILESLGSKYIDEFFRIFSTLSKTMTLNQIVDLVVIKYAGKAVRDFHVPDAHGIKHVCTYYENGTIRVKQSGKTFSDIHAVYSLFGTPKDLQENNIYFLD